MENAMQAEKVERLYRNYYKLMVNIAQKVTDDRQLAEDAVQNTFLKVIRIVDQIREEEPHKTKRLLGMMCRQAVTELYKRKKRVIGSCDDWYKIQYDGLTPDRYLEWLMYQETLGELALCIGLLDEKYGMPITMRYLKGVPVSEIALQLGIPENTVYMRIYRARAKLKENMERISGNG